MPGNRTETRRSVYHWDELDRASLKGTAPEALVLVPLGALEQHGPHLPTGTDIFLSTAAVERATALAAEESARDFIIASFLRIGSSDHHFPFGGTISLAPATLLLVLTDALKGMVHSGVRRVVLVNGHGGNTGICHAAASALSTTSDLSFAAIDYWNFGREGYGEAEVPGHAGRWETSLILASRPELVRERKARKLASDAPSPGGGVYCSRIWSALDGHTDDANLGTSAEGQDIWSRVETGLAARLVELSKTMP